MSELLLWILIYSPLNRNLICSSYDGSVIKKILLNKHFYPATPLCSKHFTEIKFGVWVLNQWYHSFTLLSLCLLVILGHFYSDTLFVLCLIFTRFYCLCSCFLCLYAKMHWVCMISRVFPHTLVILLLPLPLLPLSPADCRFYHIWSFTAPCLTGFQDHFLPALPLAASCSVSTHVNSGIGRNMKSGQDERIGLESDVVSVNESLTVSKCRI